jgi:hypothetical protein
MNAEQIATIREALSDENTWHADGIVAGCFCKECSKARKELHSKALAILDEAFPEPSKSKRPIGEVFAEIRAEYGAEFDKAFPEPSPGADSADQARKALDKLLCKVNRVTCAYRHGHHRQSIPLADLDELCNYQIEVEALLASRSEPKAEIEEIAKLQGYLDAECFLRHEAEARAEAAEGRQEKGALDYVRGGT